MTSREAESSHLGDVFPAVSVDRTYGEQVDFLDIDLALITEYLRARGVGDERIKELDIKLIAQTKKTSDGTRLLQGEYEHGITAIWLFMPAYAIEHSTSFVDENGKPVTFTYEVADTQGEDFTRILIHELEHFISMGEPDYEQRKNAFFDEIFEQYTQEVYPKGFRTSLAMAVVAFIGAKYFEHKMNEHVKKDRDNRYRNNPEEVRAWQAADTYVGDSLVKIQPKKAFYPGANIEEVVALAVLSQRYSDVIPAGSDEQE